MIHLGWQPTPEERRAMCGLEDNLKKTEYLIALYSHRHGGCAPSLAEIAAAFSVTKETARHYVDALIEAGRAERLDGKLFLISGVYKHPLLSRVEQLG